MGSLFLSITIAGKVFLSISQGFNPPGNCHTSIFQCEYVSSTPSQIFRHIAYLLLGYLARSLKLNKSNKDHHSRFLPTSSFLFHRFPYLTWFFVANKIRFMLNYSLFANTCKIINYIHSISDIFRIRTPLPLTAVTLA